MFSKFCILQDILTKEIIGHGIERERLYYVDEVVHKGHADILHLGTLRFYFLVYLLVTLSPSNVKLVYGQRIIELLFILKQ